MFKEYLKSFNLYSKSHNSKYKNYIFEFYNIYLVK